MGNLASAATQFNKYQQRLPVSLLSKGFPLGAVFVISEVSTFDSVKKDGTKMTCNRSYEGFRNNLGLSRATVARSVKAGKERGYIDRVSGKQYVCNREKVSDDLFLRVPGWLHREKFFIKNKERKLILSERLVFSYFYTKCNRNGSEKYYIGSPKDIASAVGLSEKTVERALYNLMHADLIYRLEKGVNVYVKGRYTVNFKLIRSYEKTEKDIAESSATSDRRETQPSSKKPDADGERLKTIEQTYYERKYLAETTAERNLELARRDPKFREADDDLKRLIRDVAFGLASDEELSKVRAIRSRRARELGYNRDSFVPQYSCKLCNDTGYRLTDGSRCKCFPPGRV